MTKSELMARLAEQFVEKNESTVLQSKDIEYSVKVLVDTMTRALAKGQRFELPSAPQGSQSQNRRECGSPCQACAAFQTR